MHFSVQLIVRGTFQFRKGPVKNPRLNVQKGDTIAWDPATGELLYKSAKHPGFSGPLALLQTPYNCQGDVSAVEAIQCEDGARFLVGSVASWKRFGLDEGRPNEGGGKIIWILV